MSTNTLMDHSLWKGCFFTSEWQSAISSTAVIDKASGQVMSQIGLATGGPETGGEMGPAGVVDNRAGAGGNIGAQAVASADPDGYTLLATPPGRMTINQNLDKDMRFDPAKFAPIIMLSSVPNVITTRPDFPANSVKELIAYAMANPGKVTYASQGNGSTSHLTGQMFASMSGTDMIHVPFKGEGSALNELLGGRVDLFMGNISAVLKFHQDNRVKLLGLAAPRRIAMAPSVPTVAESGLPDFNASAWFAAAAPPGTPATITRKLNAAIAEILKMPDVQQKFAAQGAEVVGGSPADMTVFMDAERARWKKPRTSSWSEATGRVRSTVSLKTSHCMCTLITRRSVIALQRLND